MNSPFQRFDPRRLPVQPRAERDDVPLVTVVIKPMIVVTELR